MLVSVFAHGGEIHDAIKRGDMEQIRTILANNPNLLENYSADGFTPLHTAVFYGRYEIVKELLIEKKAEATATVHVGQYAGWNSFHLLALKVKEMPACNQIFALLDMCGCNYNATVTVNGKKLYPWDIAKIIRNRTVNMLFEFTRLAMSTEPEKQPKSTISDSEVDAQSIEDVKKVLKSLFGSKD
jgi:hypothetical protein